MKIEKRITITYLYPGSFFSETSSERVESTDIPKTVPADCYGFYFTETEVAVSLEGKEFIGNSKSVGKTYVIGEAIHVDDIPEILDGRDTDILKTNIRNNSPTKKGIKTHVGVWQVEDERTVAISPKQFKFGKPKIYENFGKNKK